MKNTTVFAALIFAGAASVGAQQWDTIYQSKYAVWLTPPYNLKACQKYQGNLDSIEMQLDKALPLVVSYLGIPPAESPQRVEIDSGTQGMGGWAGGGDVGYQISDFYGAPTNGDGLRWIRGVVLGEVINSTTGAVTDNWPRDWWADDVWYFPGFVAGEILRQVVSPTFADYWLTSEHYPTYPVYNMYVNLLKQQGWDIYKRFFATVKADGMQWANIGGNPSKIKTEYIAAYLSLAAGRNLSADFKTAKVTDADGAVMDSIMYDERGLKQADLAKKNTTSAWNDFRAGNYASARKKLDALGIVVAVYKPSPAPAAPRFPDIGSRIFSLTGRDLGGEPASSRAGFYVLRHPD